MSQHPHDICHCFVSPSFLYSVKLPIQRSHGRQTVRQTVENYLTTENMRQRLPTLRWLVPLALILLVTLYEVGPARWIYRQLGFTYHTLSDIIMFGTIGPILAYLGLTFVARWLEEKETADLQAAVLAQARADASASRQLSDDAVQVLFASGTLLELVKEACPDIPEETAVQLNTMEQALNSAIHRLRTHLLQAQNQSL